MTSPYQYSMTRSRRKPAWRRWLLALIGIAVLFLAPALAHSATSARSVDASGAAGAPAAGLKNVTSAASIRPGPTRRFR
jgi:hypothetical protein